MKQVDKVKKAIAAGKTTIQGILQFTGDIPEPSIRRVLGQGAIKGIFKRIGRGSYTLTTPEGEQRAYIECGKAEEILPILQASGQKYDMAFLDIAYFSKELIGRNRETIKYDFLYPEQFAEVMRSLYKMMRTEDSHVYLMLSKAPSTQKDMQKYVFAALESGFKICEEGNYNKTYKNGQPVTNVRGKKAAPERIILLTKSGHAREAETPIQMEFTCERPPLKTSYSTQKAEEFVTQIIRQSSVINDVLLDAAAGSGIFGKCALALNRIVHLVEKLESAIENFIIPKIQQFAIN